MPTPASAQPGPRPPGRPDAAVIVPFVVALSIAAGAAAFRGLSITSGPGVASSALAMLLVVLLAWLPGYIRYGRLRGDWARFLQYAGRATIVVTGLVLLNDLQRGNFTRSADMLAEFRAGRISAYEFIREARLQARRQFDADVLEGVRQTQEAAWQAVAPGARLRDFTLVDVAETPRSLRIAVRFSGELPDEGEDRPFEGTVVTYFHAGGAASIEGTCFSSFTDCSRLNGLLSQAETALGGALEGPALGRVLPDGGVCEVEEARQPQTGATFPALSCDYGDGVTLSFTRRSGEQMAEQMIELLDRDAARRASPAAAPRPQPD